VAIKITSKATKPCGPGPGAKHDVGPVAKLVLDTIPILPDTPPFGRDPMDFGEDRKDKPGPMPRPIPVDFGQEHKGDIPLGKHDTPPIGKEPFDYFGEDRKDAVPIGMDGGAPCIEFVSFDEEQHSIYYDLADWQGGMDY